MKLVPLVLILLLEAAGACAGTVAEITQLVSQGHWQQAGREITAELARTNLDFQTQQDLLFQRDRMARLRLDFDRTREQTVAAARKVAPQMTDAQFAAWEKAGFVESMEIDGTRWYFRSAGPNVFRLNPEAKALKGPGDKDLYRLQDIRKTIAAYDKTGSPVNLPHTWRVTYSVTVKPDMVPAGETIRAWLPFPHAANRQQNIRLISSDPPEHVLSNTNAALASVYLEKSSLGHQPTVFQIIFEVASSSFYQFVDPARAQPVPENDPALKPFMGEQPPNIVFSDELKKLSREIVGTETNSYLQARRLFKWVYEQVPWASAREYSAMEALPAYALAVRHGDCGIKGMTFMAFCRLNGIPARWESGWTTDPEKDMHDWCEIYLAPYGWLPVDPTYGLVDSADDREKWFYLGGIDAGRIIVNTDHTQPLYPAKNFFRSEIIDFQRGEVEWRGGNLYFNQWSYNFEVAEMHPAANPPSK